MKSVQKCKYQQSFKSSGLVFMKCVPCLQHVSIYAAYLYDAVMLYARALDKLLKEYEVVTDQILDEVSRNGTRIIEMLKNDTYYSKCRGLCATTHSRSHLALDVSFYGWNEHSYNSGTQWTLSKNSTKVTKNFTCTIEGIPNMPPPLFSLLHCRVAGIIFLRTLDSCLHPCYFTIMEARHSLFLSRGKRGNFHSYIFLSPCFFTLIVDWKPEQLSNSILFGLT
jgi:hypothetical protein